MITPSIPTFSRWVFIISNKLPSIRLPIYSNITNTLTFTSIRFYFVKNIITIIYPNRFAIIKSDFC